MDKMLKLATLVRIQGFSQSIFPLKSLIDMGLATRENGRRAMSPVWDMTDEHLLMPLDWIIELADQMTNNILPEWRIQQLEDIRNEQL